MSDDTAPVGAVMAFGGPRGQMLSDLYAAGWIPCDNTSYLFGTGTYDALYAVIQKYFGAGPGDNQFNVPDLRGTFARGVDHSTGRDPNADARLPSAQGASAGDHVGSAQSWATGRPSTDFLTASAGQDHSHSVEHVPTDHHDNAATAVGENVQKWTTTSATTSSAGAHTHTVSSGGDVETRPDNLSLYWYIKYAAGDGTAAGATAVAVGTVLAFAGDLTDSTLQQSLKDAGWLPCWGDTVALSDYPDLGDAIQGLYGNVGADQVQLPDLKGRFVRGASNVDAQRIGMAMRPATARPRTGGLATSTDGAHTHTVKDVVHKSYEADVLAGHTNAAWNSGSKDTSLASTAHQHVLDTGGDKETRPVNVYLDYIIKAKLVTAAPPGGK